MKQADRERLVKVLMHGVERTPARVRRAFERMADEDLDAIEPIIDEIIAREVAAAMSRFNCSVATLPMLQSSPRREHLVKQLSAQTMERRARRKGCA